MDYYGSERKTRSVSVSFDFDLLRRVDRIADAEGRPRSHIITRAMREYCDAYEGGVHPSEDGVMLSKDANST